MLLIAIFAAIPGVALVIGALQKRFQRLRSIARGLLVSYITILLILGLGTRIVSLLLSSTMVVALLTADRPGFLEALAGGDVTSVTPFVYLLFLLWLAVYGAGSMSLDRMLKNSTFFGNIHPLVRHLT